MQSFTRWYLNEILKSLLDRIILTHGCCSSISPGENIPCKQDSAVPVFYTQDPNVSPLFDRGSLDLGRIRNTGHFPVATYPNANLLKLQATAAAQTHALNVDTATATFTIGVTYGPTTTSPYVTSNTVTFSDAAPTFSIVSEYS